MNSFGRLAASALRQRSEREARLGQLFKLHPLADSRWQAFVERHDASSVFHTTAWLRALHLTYGFEPVVYAQTSPGGDLLDGIPFCRVNSWLTGKRLVSLPFSDHCRPLVTGWHVVGNLVGGLAQAVATEDLRYVELRLPGATETGHSVFQSALPYILHVLDLTPGLGTLFQKFHKSSTQRRIRRAERSGLLYREGRSEALLESFYYLLVLTRRRHRIPPQPKTWFRNLIGCFGKALQIRVASLDGRPVAAILTLRHRDTLVYKYGCSDPHHRSLGGTHFLFWRAIQEAKRDGLRFFDLGRSAADHQGLITFKDRWGATRIPLTYVRVVNAKYASANYQTGAHGWGRHLAGQALSYLPACMLDWLARAIYRHAA